MTKSSLNNTLFHNNCQITCLCLERSERNDKNYGKKTLSIAEQIVDLEADLEQKNAELKEYEKIFDRYLKLVFGMDKKVIQKLIQELQKKVSAEPVKLPATNGVDDDFQNGNTSS